MTPADKNCASDADPSALSMQEALNKILALCTPPERTEVIDVATAMHRVCASDIVADISVPPFRSSAMDGYAIKHAQGEVTLDIVGSSLAGHPYNGSIPDNSCVRITTGACVPDDADTVVMQENTTVSSNTLQINKLPVLGFNVRDIGSDHTAGELLLSAGTELKAAEIALLASHGFSKVTVGKPLLVSVISTGDELHDASNNPDAKLKHGGIYDSNRALLINMLQSPAIQCIDSGICSDSLDSIASAFDQSADADLVISTGGVSVGDADFVKDALAQTGELAMWKIAMKPGRPLTFGKLNSGAVFFGLPGNPVSAAVTCLFFVKPALRSMQGQQPDEIITIEATVDSDLSKLPGRIEYQRGILSGSAAAGYQVATTGLQDSHVLTSLHKANCFVELPLDSQGADAGSTVTVIPFSAIGDNLI